MRGADTVTVTESLFKVCHPGDFVPADHPLRPIGQMVNEALVKMDVLFAGMYEADIKGGRPRISPPSPRPAETAARRALASVLQRALRDPAHGANLIQLAISLVHRSCHG